MKKIIVIIFALAVAAVGLFFIFSKTADKNEIIKNNASEKKEFLSNSFSAVAIPEKVLSNKFGFLGGQEEENPFIGDVGGAWARPHPGPFLWDSMQKDKNSKIDFSKTDKIINYQQAQNYGTLATLWPFAEWDQLKRSDAAQCAVDPNDEFLSKNDKKGRGDYLPTYRCAPVDDDAYIAWIKEVVERYDGDGKNDMPGLKIPVKYWEVSNEPDLTPGPDGRLVFWRDTPQSYADLLIKTYKAIKETDPEAKVLIAGAAGADEMFLGFYKKVLANDEAKNSFDIANVHCISNDRGKNDFNVGAYKKMLAELKISKPIWVTEAESFNGKTAQENYELTKKSTQGAISAGAEKIFYTRYDFDDFRTDMSQKNIESEASILDSQKKYQSIISQYE